MAVAIQPYGGLIEQAKLYLSKMISLGMKRLEAH